MTLDSCNNVDKLFIISTTLLSATSAVSGVPQLDGVSYDPAFISAGDRVNISANIHETSIADKTWNDDRELKVILKPGNRLTEEYVTIEDDKDDSIGFLYPEGRWNQKYQVKIDSGAPTGDYDFELHIQYLENDEPVKIYSKNNKANLTYVEKFSMPVDNEGVDLSTDVTETEPSVPRPGDNYVEVKLDVTNTGNKPLEELELLPNVSKNIETSFSSDEKFYIDRLGVPKSAERTLTLNLDDKLEPGVHKIKLKAIYEDEDGNKYDENLYVPLRVEGRPDLEIKNSSLTMKAGETSELRLKLENKGEQDAESTTARAIVERAQPFSLKDRSNYIGEIESGQVETAVLKVSADRSATLKNHQIKVELRANGDSEEGDNSVYTYTDEVSVQLEGRDTSGLIFLGFAGAVLVLIVAVYRYIRSGKGVDQDEK